MLCKRVSLTARRWCSENLAKRAPPAPPKKTPLDASCFKIKTGRIESIKVHEEAEWLFVEQVALGEEAPLTICSGLVSHVEKENLLHKDVLVLMNLKPREIKGVPSEAMLLCAVDSAGAVTPLQAPPCPPGTPVTFVGISPSDSSEQILNSKKLKKLLPDLHTGSDGIVRWKTHAMMVGQVVVEGPPNADVS
eukprot:TRINITY_DN37485_c0_g1_i1.p1 TRINITY_DN37485_c0_g1~~TRINITY_DN37485_c0_g1_i1.p1  ORF type:complete len:192 (+),score=34.06 TRINITY_DN37485_c0_g1_i1:42-617(+)